ncbi:cupin domain-containing protein [Persephonella sp.]|uniref:cupin domain-containing protein n=1 Tax=Persephonella sp. TaxID=2060922 RepID=UPI0025E436DC|nr:cupin domain-containing protein [Persephonella sp.]
MSIKIYPVSERFDPVKPVSEKMIATDNLVVVHFYLKEGQKIPLHASKSDVFVTVLKGKGKFYYGSENSYEALETGESLYYQPEEPHGFEAEEDMIVQAIISPNPQKKITL